MYPNGEGRIVINGREVEQYFGREALSSVARSPLRLLELSNRCDVSVMVVGGGVSGQAGAVRHGLARALVRLDESFRPALR
ncbi:MAG: 30S ribosomal protein S9, partial [Ktedonobacterales bacterium]